MIALIYAFGWYTPVFHLLHAWVPGVDLFRRPADATFVFGGLLAYLAAAFTADLVAPKPDAAVAPQRLAAGLGGIILLLALALAWLMGAPARRSRPW